MIFAGIFYLIGLVNVYMRLRENKSDQALFGAIVWPIVAFAIVTEQVANDFLPAESQRSEQEKK